MDATLNRKSLALGIPGIVLQIAGRIVQIQNWPDSSDPTPPPIAIVAILVALVGTVLLILGLSYYAAAKGHSRWAGLLGILSIIGIIILACLPDRNKATAR